jgi:cobalamin biosynthesis protein CobD/CbiB
MKKDKVHKLLLSIVVLLLLLNFMQGIFSDNTAEAQKESQAVGRYQISAWAAYSGVRLHHTGYYVVDSVTGKVVESKSEVHGSEK